jgi:small-conductance mechanosensitive channel
VSSLCEDSRTGVCEWVVGLAGDNETVAGVLAWLVGRPLEIVVIVLVTFVGVRFLKNWIRAAVHRVVVGAPDDASDSVDGLPTKQRAEARAGSIASVLAGSAGIAVWTISIITVLGIAGIEVAPMIAGAGIAGLALSFGAQNVIRDIVAGLFILVEDQFGIGDVIEVDGVSGTVEAISLRATQLRSVNGTLWFVPNGQINQMGNMTKSWSAAILDVDVAYGADIGRVRSVLASVATELVDDVDYGGVMVEPPQVMGVEALGADSVTVRVVLKVAPGQQWVVQRVLRERVKAALDDAGIEIPFPQRTVWLRNSDE